MKSAEKVLLADWYNHQANVCSLTNAVITLTKNDSTIKNILDELKDEIEWTHEHWLDLRAIGITSTKEALQKIFAQHEKEEF